MRYQITFGDGASVVIFFHDAAQEEVARGLMAELEVEGPWTDPIVTELSPLDVFYPAEAYHDDYYRKNPAQPYCQAVINPKLAKFRARFAHKLRGSKEA